MYLHTLHSIDQDVVFTLFALDHLALCLFQTMSQGRTGRAHFTRRPIALRQRILVFCGVRLYKLMLMKGKCTVPDLQ